MPISPLDAYNFGLELGQQGATEIAHRTGVSKLYYSVYLEVRDKLGVKERRRAHDAVRAALQKRTGRSTGGSFSDLRELREMADYELPHDLWDRKFIRAKRLADEILREFRRRVT